jgi:hypothetical protein
MSWLVGAKVLPALREGTPPDYRQEFVEKKATPPLPVAWDLYWNDKPVGQTFSQAFLADGEPSEVRSLVQFRNLAVREVARELLGGMSFLADSMLGRDSLHLDLNIATRLRFDWEGEIQGFETSVKGPHSMGLLFFRGHRTDDDKLRVVASTGESDLQHSGAPLAQEFNLPSKARYADVFSPRSRMLGLWVGQKWTTPVINPLASNGSLRLVESLVERREQIEWQGDLTEVFVVVYRYDAGSAASRDPVGLAWVRDDGIVVRQELPLGGARVRFERTRDERARELAAGLQGRAFDHMMTRDAASH